MPGGDRTGPRGMGPKTGRAAGYCTGYEGPGSMNNAPGRGAGFGYGRGGGRGMGFRWGGGGGYGRGAGWRWRNLQPLAEQPDQPTDGPATLQALQDELQRLQTRLSEMGDQIRSLVSSRLQAKEDK